MPVPLHPGHFSNPLLPQHEHIRTVFVPGFGRITFLSPSLPLFTPSRLSRKPARGGITMCFPRPPRCDNPGCLTTRVPVTTMEWRADNDAEVTTFWHSNETDIVAAWGA